MKEYIEREAVDNSFMMLGYAVEDLPRRMIRIIPAEDVAPVVHGRWEYPLGMAWNYVCSECGANGGVTKQNYCPNCGAKMDGGADNG